MTAMQQPSVVAIGPVVNVMADRTGGSIHTEGFRSSRQAQLPILPSIINIYIPPSQRKKYDENGTGLEKLLTTQEVDQVIKDCERRWKEANANSTTDKEDPDTTKAKLEESKGIDQDTN